MSVRSRGTYLQRLRGRREAHAPVRHHTVREQGHEDRTQVIGWFLYYRQRWCYDRDSTRRSVWSQRGLLLRTRSKERRYTATFSLPVIMETSRASSVERLLRVESALLEYGSSAWMEWFALRLRYADYHPEVSSYRYSMPNNYFYIFLAFIYHFCLLF